jgi:hypothetical protein
MRTLHSTEMKPFSAARTAVNRRQAYGRMRQRVQRASYLQLVNKSQSKNV